MLPRLFTSTALLAGAAHAAKPVYDVAHKVLREKGLDAALKNEAGAIEIDLTAWRKGDTGSKGDDKADTSRWWIDHDGDGDVYGDPADKLLAAIGDKGADQLAFVVFDVKNPDYCDVEEEGCGMATLVDMAEEHVLSKGIGVVWGFISHEDAAGDAFAYVMGNLHDDAGVRITGRAEDVLEAFDAHGGDIPKNKRINDYGSPYLGKNNPSFGKCECDMASDDVCPNISCAIGAKDDGDLGSVWMWTVGSSDGDGDRTSYALDGRIDGIVFGYANEEYEDSKRNVKARGHIVGWTENHDDLGRMCGKDDRPWK